MYVNKQQKTAKDNRTKCKLMLKLKIIVQNRLQTIFDSTLSACFGRMLFMFWASEKVDWSFAQELPFSPAGLVMFKRLVREPVCLLFLYRRSSWFIWEARNDLIFNDSFLSTFYVVDKIKYYTFSWLKNRDKLDDLAWHTWCNFNIFRCDDLWCLCLFPGPNDLLTVRLNKSFLFKRNTKIKITTCSLVIEVN